MAHIVDFKIEGLAGRKGIYQKKLDRHLNVFFGLNGSGKTSLLKILESSMSRNSQSIINTPFKKAEVNIYSIDYDDIFLEKINKDVLKGANRREMIDAVSDHPETTMTYASDDFEVVRSQRQRFQWEETPRDKRVKNEFIGWKHTYLPITRLLSGSLIKNIDRESRLNDISAETEEIWDRNYAETLLRLWIYYYNDVLSDVRKIQEDGFAQILSSLLTGSKLKNRKQKKLNVEEAYEKVKSFLTRQGSNRALPNYKKFAEHFHESEELKNIVLDIDNVENKIIYAMSAKN